MERAITIPSSMFNIGMVVGPILGGLVADRWGIGQIYILSAGLFAVSTVVILFARKHSIDIHHDLASGRPNLIHNTRFIGLLGLIGLTTFALYLPQPLTPNFLQNEVHLPLRTIGQLGSIGSLGNALLVLGFGHLRAPVGFLTGTALVGIFSLLMWQGRSVGWFAIGYFFIGGFRLTRAMSIAYVRYAIRGAEAGLAFGLIETANGLAVILAPLLAGRLYATDPRSMYIVSLALITVLVVANLLVRARRPEKQELTPVQPLDKSG